MNKEDEAFFLGVAVGFISGLIPVTLFALFSS